MVLYSNLMVESVFNWLWKFLLDVVQRPSHCPVLGGIEHITWYRRAWSQALHASNRWRPCPCLWYKLAVLYVWSVYLVVVFLPHQMGLLLPGRAECALLGISASVNLGSSCVRDRPMLTNPSGCVTCLVNFLNWSACYWLWFHSCSPLRNG